MSNGYPTHSIETASDAARPLFERARRAFGHVPNVFAKMAESPALFEAYLAVDEIFESKTKFTPLERHAIMQAANRANGCRYCLAAHGHGAVHSGVATAEIDRRLREGQPTGDARLDALHHFTTRMIEQRGWIEPPELAAFLAAGFTREQVLDIVLAVSLKSMSNYANHITHPEIDARYREPAIAD